MKLIKNFWTYVRVSYYCVHLRFRFKTGHKFFKDADKIIKSKKDPMKKLVLLNKLLIKNKSADLAVKLNELLQS